MRIWSKSLIPVLPTKQLKAMRYELGDMIKQYPNIKHPLVKFANYYNIKYLAQYFKEVCNECEKRGIKMNHKYNMEIWNLWQIKVPLEDNGVPNEACRFKEDNRRYLIQCYYNLQEKYDRGIITQEEWEKLKSCPDFFDVDAYDGIDY